MQGLRLGEAARHIRHRPALQLALALTLLFLVCGIVFGAAQNVSIDEATQLSGASLPVDRLVSWLAGMPEPSFGVPPDQMPPFSYLIDYACGQTLCGGAHDFRMLHLLIALVGVGITLALAARAGVLATIGAGAILVLSPKLTELAVEIRAYPIFFTLTAVQIALIYRIIGQARLDHRWVIALGVAGVAAIYTHFFGLVSTMALMGGLFVSRVRGWRDGLWIGGCTLALLIAAIGLQPFIGGANAASLPQDSATVSLGEIAKFLLRLIGHPANLLVLPAGMLFFAAAALLAAVEIVRIGVALARDPMSARGRPEVALAAALIVGLVVTLLAALLVHGFNALKVVYSLWTLPIIALLAADACRGIDWRAPWDARVRRALPFVVALLVAGAAVGQGLFLLHGRWFVHGPSRAIAEELRAEPGATGVIYDDVDWPFGFFPTYYSFSEGVPQWLLGSDGQLHRLAPGGLVVPQADTPDALADLDHVLLISIHSQPHSALRPLLTGARDPQREAEHTPPPVGFSGWHHAATRAEPGLYWTRIDRFDKDPL